MRHLFERSYEATAEILERLAGDPAATIRAAYQIFLDIPAAQRHALRAISSDIGPDRPEVRKAKAHMRDRILALWVPCASKYAGLDDDEARCLTWMLTSAAWGLSDLVEDGSVGEDRAKDLLAQFAARVMTPTAGVGS